MNISQKENSPIVPRGTNEKLLIYFQLLQKWNKKINLVSADDLRHEGHFWQRHILDAAQLAAYIQENERILDVGSGAGLPALILAAYGFSHVTAVESDARKCEFLKEAARQMQVALQVMHSRVEQLDQNTLPAPISCFTARAFASLKDIFALTETLCTPDARYLLLKGKQIQEEINAAETEWNFDYELQPSKIGGDGIIIIARNVQNKTKQGGENG